MLQAQDTTPLETLKAMRGRLVVAVNMNQRDDFEIELAPGLKLWMNKDWGPDGKITNPSLAVVRAIGEGITDISVGDVLLCHHNTFDRTVANGYLYGHMGKEADGKLDLFSAEYSMVYLKVDAAGHAHPITGYLTVERIPQPVDTSLIVPETAMKNYPNRFKVLETGAGVDDLQPGMVIETYKCSDVDVHYTWNGKEKLVVRVKYEDVIGIHN